MHEASVQRQARASACPQVFCPLVKSLMELLDDRGTHSGLRSDAIESFVTLSREFEDFLIVGHYRKEYVAVLTAC